MPELQGLLFELERLGVIGIALQLLIVVVATIIALRFASVTISSGLSRLFEREVREGTAQDLSAVELERRRVTLDGLLNRSLRVIILIIAFLMILNVLRLDIGPAIAGLGLVGLALSLGAQHLVRDYVAGAFVLIENQYSKGDVVTIADVTGSVEDISLRRTTVRDLDGTVHHVPHGLIQTSGNLTRSWARINLDIPVLYGQDLGRLRELLDGVGQELAQDAEWKSKVLEPPRLRRIESLGDQGITLKMLGTVRAVDRWAAAGELRRRIIDAFAREGLTLGWRIPPPPPPPAPDESEKSGRKQ